MSEPLRILFVTQYFPPETGAAPARAAHFARALAREGHEVRIVTGFPSHPSGVFASPRRIRVRETWEGCRVDRVWLYATPKKTALRRLWNHISFSLTALPACLAGPRPDVVLASTPPLFLGFSAWLAARLARAPLVLDVRDDWPLAAVALGELREGFVTRTLAWFARFIQKRAERIVAVTPGMRRQLGARQLEERRIDLITNGADTDLFKPGPPAGARNGFTVLYAGTHGLVHGMEVILDAAERLRGRDVRFLLVGDGVAKAGIEQGARDRGLEAIEFRPSVAPERLVSLIHDADVCLATTRAHPFCGETIPVKLFDYMACARPVVAAVLGDAAAVVAASGGGVVVQPEDGDMLAEALGRLAADAPARDALGRAGAAYVEANYSRRALGKRLEAAVRTAHLAARGRTIRGLPDGAFGFCKRLMDFAIALVSLIVIAPVLLIIGLVVRFDSPGPALFRQRRSGRGAREFTIIKFRTMQRGTPDLASHLMGPGAATVTRIGAFLRRTSLDELPQLWNVLVGDMSLVGPRPALHNQHDLIARRQEAGVDALRPGVTGWAQVNGRDAISLEEKVAFDRHYLASLSPLEDLRILALTIRVLFSSRGVY